MKAPLGDGTHSYALLLVDPLMAFFGIRTTEEVLDFSSLLREQPIFRIWVMKYAISKGVFPYVGHVEVPDSLLERPWFCKQDSISGRLTRYRSDPISKTYEERAADFDECKELEVAAVWHPEHVVDRLNDFFANRPNKWVESIRPRQR